MDPVTEPVAEETAEQLEGMVMTEETRTTTPKPEQASATLKSVQLSGWELAWPAFAAIALILGWRWRDVIRRV